MTAKTDITGNIKPDPASIRRHTVGVRLNDNELREFVLYCKSRKETLSNVLRYLIFDAILEARRK
jgi:hypothetical protein